jgi:hypothetical protein
MHEASHQPLQQVTTTSGPVEHEIVQAILAAIKSLRYGSVEIIVQDSKVVQIERREKIRFDKDGTKKAR